MGTLVEHLPSHVALHEIQAKHRVRNNDFAEFAVLGKLLMNYIFSLRAFVASFGSGNSLIHTVERLTSNSRHTPALINNRSLVHMFASSSYLSNAMTFVTVLKLVPHVWISV